MKTKLKILTAVSVLAQWFGHPAANGRAAAPATVAGQVDEAELLAALAEVETGTNPTAIGPYGERSVFQFTLGTWKQHTPKDFELATIRPDLALVIARTHLTWLIHTLRKRGVAIRATTLAAAWHYGWSHAATCASTDYAKRVNAIYEDNRQKTAALLCSSPNPKTHE